MNPTTIVSQGKPGMAEMMSVLTKVVVLDVVLHMIEVEVIVAV